MSPPARCYATSSRGRRTRDRSRPRASLLATTTGAPLLTTTTRSRRDRATLGSRHRGVADLRDPPAGPHVPAARRVLPVVADEGPRRSHRSPPPAEFCPLCPTRDPAAPTEVPESAYQLVVFDNKFPSLSPSPP